MKQTFALPKFLLACAFLIFAYSPPLLANQILKCTLCPPHTNLYCPWYTGPLIIPYRYVIPYPLSSGAPYIYATTRYGGYDAHWHFKSRPNFFSTTVAFDYEHGVHQRVDFMLSGQFSYNRTQGVSDTVINDTLFYLNYALLEEDPCQWPPYIKLSFIGIIPTGKYQRLNPKKLETDLGGFGNWAPGIGMAMSKRFVLGSHYFFPELSISYEWGTPLHVKGVNAYGGGHGTKGNIHPGNLFEVIFSYEFTLNQNWVFACDHIYFHTNRSRFSGRKGQSNGIPNSVGRPSTEQFSLTPAIEYNWSANGGAITGVWFTVAGRNASAFASYVISAFLVF